MRKMKWMLALCLLAGMTAGCSDDDESSVKIVYDPVVHSGESVSIRPADTVDDIFETALKFGANSVTVPLNPGNYEFRATGLSVKYAFQVRPEHQTRIYYGDDFSVTVQ